MKVEQSHFDLVIDALKNGISVMQLCRNMREQQIPFPSASALYAYCYSTKESREIYMHAREVCTHALADEIVNIADTTLDPQRARNMIQARQWVASKINPKNYGEKLDIDVNQKVDVSIAVNAARNRLAAMKQDNQLIDITPQSAITTTDIQSDVSNDIDPFS